jgi:hypothetical protein
LRLDFGSNDGSETSMTTDRPLGQKFSQVYLDRSVPNEDGIEWRIRLGAFIQEDSSKDSFLNYTLMVGAGVIIESRSYIDGKTYRFDKLINEVKIAKLLDICTIIYRNYNIISEQDAKIWVIHFNTCCREENIPYFMDEEGGVHPAVDAEFQHNLASTIRGLDAPRYRTALTAFSGIQPALDREETRLAIIQVFITAESIVKMMTGANGLDASIIKRQLTNRIKVNWAEGAAKAANQMVAGFVNWVNAAHTYRHAPGEPDAAEPPLDLAILMISVGASYIRWLIDQDQQALQNQPNLSLA